MSKHIQLCTIELSNGETLGYREGGFGPTTIILVHGNLTSSKHWDILIEKLIPKYKVYAIDLRGYGMSTYNKPINSLKDFAQDLHLFVQTLALKDFILAGWSTGGAVSMEFVANYPNLARKLILLQSVGIKGLKFYKKKTNPIDEPVYFKSKQEFLEDETQIRPVLEAIKTGNKEFFKKLWNSLIYTDNQPNAEKYNEYLEDMLTQRNHIDVYCALTYFNISSDHNGVVLGSNLVEKICIPTLIIHGKKDRVIPLEEAIETKSAIGKNAELKLMDNVGHSPLIDNLSELTEIFINYIKK